MTEVNNIELKINDSPFFKGILPHDSQVVRIYIYELTSEYLLKCKLIDYFDSDGNELEGIINNTQYSTKRQKNGGNNSKSFVDIQLEAKISSIECSSGRVTIELTTVLNEGSNSEFNNQMFNYISEIKTKFYKNFSTNYSEAWENIILPLACLYNNLLVLIITDNSINVKDFIISKLTVICSLLDSIDSLDMSTVSSPEADIIRFISNENATNPLDSIDRLNNFRNDLLASSIKEDQIGVNVNLTNCNDIIKTISSILKEFLDRYNFVENDIKIEVNKEKNLFYFNVRSRYLREFVFLVKEFQKLQQELEEKKEVDEIERFNTFSFAECIQYISFDENKVSELEYCKISADSDEFIADLSLIESKAKKVIENRKISQINKLKLTELKSEELCASHSSDEDVVSIKETDETLLKKFQKNASITERFNKVESKQSNDDYLSDDSSGTYCSD